MSRRIGAQITEVCEVLAVLGSSDVTGIFGHVDMTRAAIGRSCNRAVKYGLMRVVAEDPREFELVPGWEDVIHAPRPHPKRRAKQESTYAPHHLVDVWHSALRATL